MTTSRKRSDGEVPGTVDSPAPPPASDVAPPAPDLTTRQFTARAVLTGSLIGAVLSVSNLYIALKVGLGVNMSITAALLGYGAWGLANRFNRHGDDRRFTILENNINQTAASSAASASSAILVTAIPPLAVLTGQTLSWPALTFWVFSVCLVGIVVAVGWRRQLLVVEKLRFPVGAASAETLRALHSRGRDAVTRIMLLGGGTLASAGSVLLTHALHFRQVVLPGTILNQPLASLTFGLRPVPLLLGVGGLIGMRACASMLLGAVVAYGVLSPNLVAANIIALTERPDGTLHLTYSAQNAWLVWPGVTLMVVASLVSLAFAWRALAATLTAARSSAQSGPGGVPRETYVVVATFVLVLSVFLQVALFQIAWWAAAVGVAMSFALALVAARVSGETGITPVGSLGKVTQITLGALVPQTPACNLMTANVTGGAASQCGDLLHDFKAGLLLGALPRWQALAQVCGALAGSAAGCAAYLALFPNPAQDLFTQEFPAPSAMTWLRVAELIRDGMAALPTGAVTAMVIAGVGAAVLTILEKTLPKRFARWVPSGAAFGIAFVLPASISLTMFVGAALAALTRRVAPDWSTRYLVTICTAIIAGDALTNLALKAIEALTP